MRRNKYEIDVVSVAKHSQVVAGQLAVLHDEHVDRHDATSQRARWEEARWQLVQTIKHAPNPHQSAASGV